MRLELTAFKCFSHFAIDVLPLTVLAGVNGGGKSTVIQSLVLLHQALADAGLNGASRTDLPLNGPLLALGSLRDVVDKARGGGSFSVSLRYEGVSVSWKFAGTRDALSADKIATTWVTKEKLSRKSAELFPPALLKTPEGKRLYRTLAQAAYVPADRLGPAEVYPLLEASRHRSLGPRAERAIGSLYWTGVEESRPAAREVRHPNSAYPPRIDRQAEAWLNDLFPGVALELRRVSDSRGVPTANLVTLGLRTSSSTDFHRPQHVGFGVTYCLPVIVALVSAQPGDLVLLENPEAHLHPRAQVRITELAIRAAQAGVRVMVETHSDHVVNAVRVAVHGGKARHEDVGVHYFSRGEPGNQPRTGQMRLAPSGAFTSRPEGFLDEYERQLSELLRPPKGTKT